MSKRRKSVKRRLLSRWEKYLNRYEHWEGNGPNAGVINKGYYRALNDSRPYRSKPRVGMRVCLHGQDHVTIITVDQDGDTVMVSSGEQCSYYHCTNPGWNHSEDQHTPPVLPEDSYSEHEYEDLARKYEREAVRRTPEELDLLKTRSKQRAQDFQKYVD